MPNLSLPSSIPVKDLEATHAAYNAEKLRLYTAIYKAGSAFRDNVDQFLIKRRIEEAKEAGDLSQTHYEERKKRAHYIARGSGLIDWLTAAVFKGDPHIVAPGDPTGYWEGLNADADGLGTPLATLCRNALREVMLHNRAYFQVDFAQAEGVPAKPETMAAHVRVLKAAACDDWQHDDSGRLTWSRTHALALGRPSAKPWQQPDVERHVWTFIDAGAIRFFEATRPINGSWKQDDTAKLTVERPHQFGTPPVFEVRATEGQWVMERIYDVLVALFNRECSLSFALDQGAYSILLLTLDSTDVKQIVATEMAALKVRPGETAAFISPPPQVYDPLFRDTERLKQALYEVVQALAINAQATQTQNARQPAQAKAMDREPLQTLLTSFAWPVEEALQRLINALKTYRNETDLDVQLEGFTPSDATLDDARQIIQGSTPTPSLPSEQTSGVAPEEVPDAA